MGQISFIYLSGGKEISKDTSLFDKIAKVQYLQRKHGISKIINELKIDESIEIEIDVDKINDEIIWEQFKQLSPNIIENIKEIEYYHSIQESLKSILSELRYCRYENKDKIKNLGEQAVRIIENTKGSNFNKSLYTSKDIVGRLIYTIEQKEVNFLIEYIKPKDSIKKKTQAVNDAFRQLSLEIQMLINSL